MWVLTSVSKFGFLGFSAWSSLKLCYNCLKLWYLSKYLHWYTFGICFKLWLPWLFCLVFIKALWAAWVNTLHSSLVVCHFQSYIWVCCPMVVVSNHGPLLLSPGMSVSALLALLSAPMLALLYASYNVSLLVLLRAFLSFFICFVSWLLGSFILVECSKYCQNWIFVLCDNFSGFSFVVISKIRQNP